VLLVEGKIVVVVGDVFNVWMMINSGMGVDGIYVWRITDVTTSDD